MCTRTPWPGVERRSRKDQRKQHSGWRSDSTGNTGGTESLLGLGVSYSRCPCSQLASTHAKRAPVFYGLKCPKPILSQRRKASQPWLASGSDQGRNTIQVTSSAPRLTKLGLCNPSAWPPASKLRTSMAWLSV